MSDKLTYKVFETQAEIYQALLDGKKIKFNEWEESDKKFIYLKDGILVDNRGIPDLWAFNVPLTWSIYEEPKKKKKIKLYRYTYREDNGPDIEQTNWVSYGFKEGWSHHFTLLKTESKEIEVDDV